MRRKARRPWPAATVCVHRPAYSMSARGRDESRPYIPDGGPLLRVLPTAGEKGRLEQYGINGLRYWGLEGKGLAILQIVDELGWGVFEEIVHQPVEGDVEGVIAG